jgi:hypothetical protein
MHITTYPTKSLKGLVRQLTDQVKTFIREEVQLAKTEISEKIATLSRNAAILAVGAFVAYAGVIVLLGGLGLLAGFGLEKLGLDRVLAQCLGLAAVGLIFAAVGAVFVIKAIKTFSHESLIPEKTFETLNLSTNGGREKGGEMDRDEDEEKPKVSSDEMQAEVLATKGEVEETVGELGHRLSIQHTKEELDHKIRAHPYKSSLIVLGTGVVSGFICRRRLLRHRK